MKYYNYRDVTSVYSLNSRKLPGRFFYSLGTRLEITERLCGLLGITSDCREVVEITGITSMRQFVLTEVLTTWVDNSLCSNTMHRVAVHLLPYKGVQFFPKLHVAVHHCNIFVFYIVTGNNS